MRLLSKRHITSLQEWELYNLVIYMPTLSSPACNTYELNKMKYLADAQSIIITVVFSQKEVLISPNLHVYFTSLLKIYNHNGIYIDAKIHLFSP